MPNENHNALGSWATRQNGNDCEFHRLTHRPFAGLRMNRAFVASIQTIHLDQKLGFWAQGRNT